jgi:hypothetical protein
VAASIDFTELPNDLYGAVLLVARLRHVFWLGSAPDDQCLEAGPQRGHGGGGPRIKVQRDPVIQADQAAGKQLNLPRGEQHQV